MSGGVRDLGRHSGFIAVGEVVNRDDDPSQSGKVRVRWKTGSATQEAVADDDLPWTGSVFPSTNPSLGQTGGPHTGLQKGSTVIGIPLDGQGQDFLILGSVVSGGQSSPDEPAKFDSDIPQAGKSDSNGGESQPRYGDVNGVVCEESIVDFAVSRGGPDDAPARFSDLQDPIGTLSEPIR